MAKKCFITLAPGLGLYPQTLDQAGKSSQGQRLYLFFPKLINYGPNEFYNMDQTCGQYYKCLQS
jgi:hypothetical protein